MRETTSKKIRTMCVCLAMSAFTGWSAAEEPRAWTGWGGPGGDFGASVEPETAPEARWGELGPRVLWHRGLDPGYSAIVTEGKRLYTLVRRDEDEGIVALDPEDGSELWRRDYSAPTKSLVAVDRAYEVWPRATPLWADGTVVGFGFTGIVTAVEAATGEPRWTRNLLTEERVGVPYFGHSASPLRVEDKVVVLGGGAWAFDLETGQTLWSNRDFESSYASPILADGPAGQQLVIAGAGELVGLHPEDGRLLWRHEHANRHRTFLSTPVAGPDHTVFASAYFLGSLGLRLKVDGVEELWELPDLQVSQSNAVRHGSTVVASHNRNLTAVDLGSGEVLWREKGFGRSNLVRRGSRALLLDDRGRLSLVSLDREGFERHGRAQILDGRSWTVPTVVGERLYARNGSGIVAVDWTKPARIPGETLEGYLAAAELSSGAEAPFPEELLRLVARVEAAARIDDEASLAALDLELEPWTEHSATAVFAHYWRGFTAWRLSKSTDEKSRRLVWVDRSVADLKASLELDPRFVEAHALLIDLYNAYYPLHPGRAAVIGPLADEHGARALELAPENPRLTALRALDLIRSPVRYGGDPELGLELLRSSVERADGEAREARSPAPAWGRVLFRRWLAAELGRRGDEEGARRLTEEATALVAAGDDGPLRPGEAVASPAAAGSGG